MPYQQPTLSDLFAQAMNDVVATNVTTGRSLLSRSVLRVLAWVLSNLTWGNYDYIAWCYRQSVPWTATDENLDAWGALRGVTRKAATAAVVTLTSTGNVASTDLAAGTGLTRSDGLTFTTTSDATTDASGTVTCTAQCDTPGASGNTTAGMSFTLQAAVQGINAAFSASATVTAGADQESNDDLRSRIMQVYPSRDGGGRAVDYIKWALAVDGVTRAWCNPNGFGAGSVVIYAMLDQARAGSGGFPQGDNGAATDETRFTAATGDQLEIANALYPERPVTALVIVCAPIEAPINVALSGLAPSTAAQQAAIQAALADLYLRVGSPLGMALDPSAIESAILSTGATAFTMTSPSAPVQLPIGSIPVAGTLTVS